MIARDRGPFLLARITYLSFPILLHICFALLSFPNSMKLVSTKTSFEAALALNFEISGPPLSGVDQKVESNKDSLWDAIQKDPLLSDLAKCIESVSPVPPMMDLLQKEDSSITDYTFFAPTNDANILEWCNSTAPLSSDELNMYLSYWMGNKLLVPPPILYT